MNLRASALKGTAARLVSIVEELALPLGLRLGLASVTLRKSLAGYENRNRDSPGYGDVEEAEEVDYMRSVEIKNLVSLQGELLLDTVSLESKEGGMVPRGWDYRFWDWDDDDEEVEDYDHPGDDAVSTVSPVTVVSEWTLLTHSNTGVCPYSSWSVA